MKSTFLPALLLAALSIVSCKKDDNAATPGGSTNTNNTNTGATNRITFKVDGQTVTTAGHNLSRARMGGVLFTNITTSMHTDERTVNVNLAGVSTGSYMLDKTGYGSNGKSGGLYFPSYFGSSLNSYNFQSGTFNITRFDTSAGILEGTFEGVATNDDGSVTVQITEGRIEAGALNKDIQEL